MGVVRRVAASIASESQVPSGVPRSLVNCNRDVGPGGSYLNAVICSFMGNSTEQVVCGGQTQTWFTVVTLACGCKQHMAYLRRCACDV